MDKITANNYICLLIISFFIAIYIICLVYLFRKKSEISSLILLLIYQTMFMYYLFSKAYSNVMYKDFIGAIIWSATLISTILNFVSLLLLTLTYNHLYKEYNLDGDKTIPLSKKNKEYIDKFKKFFIVTVVLALFLTIVASFGIIPFGLLGKLLLGFLFCVVATLLGISAYNVYITNEIFKLKDTKVISQ